MKVYVIVFLAGFLFSISAFSTTCAPKPQTTQSQLVIAAIVEGIGKHPGVTSGYYKIYQLAKYKVVAVCEGTFEQKEIVVDHLLVSGDELASLHVNDKVYLTLSLAKTISLRSNQEGFRTASQTVETFYIA